MHVRVTGVLVEDKAILLLDQDTESDRSWSLPGGKVEPGEALAEALVREMREETGLEVEPGRLLYVCDVVHAQVVHVTFEVRRVGGMLGDVAAGMDSRPIRKVEFVKFAQLEKCGFSARWRDLCEMGFPGAGSYMGPKAAIGL